MTFATIETDETTDAAEAIQYRAVPPGAIVGLVLGVISAVTVVAAASSFDACLLLAAIPVLGIFVSLRSLARIRREPELYTGGRIAIAGVTLSLIFLVAGVGYGRYIFVTEVPPNHTRISFGEMRPDVAQERAGVLVPPEIMALDGQPVFIKGYIRPDSIRVRTAIDRFLLVRDNQTCCFGALGNVNYFDQIAIMMSGSHHLDYTPDVVAIGGVLHVEPRYAVSGSPLPVFSLQADYAK